LLTGQPSLVILASLLARQRRDQCVGDRIEHALTFRIAKVPVRNTTYLKGASLPTSGQLGASDPIRLPPKAGSAANERDARGPGDVGFQEVECVGGGEVHHRLVVLDLLVRVAVSG